MTPWLDASSYALNPFALQTLMVAMAVTVLGVGTLLREHWSTESILFWICTLTIGIWLASFGLMYAAQDEQLAFFWAKTAYLGVPFIPSAIYHFTVVVLRIAPRYRRQLLLSWVASAFFAFMIVSSDMLIKGLYHYSWGHYPRYGWLSIPYLAFFFGSMVATLRHYWVHSRTAEKGTQPYFRSTRLLFAFAIAYLGSVDYLAKFGIPVYPFGNVFVFCFLVLAAHVIWRYRLVDITPAFAAEQILQTMSEPLIVCDLDGKIRIVNPAYTSRFGQGQELYGQSITALASEGDEWHRRMLRSGGLKDYECAWKTRSGEKVFVSLSTSVLHSTDGKPQGFVVLARDISERKHIEQELILFNETLEDRVKERTEELANKIKELEWLNTVMMGREERILELKERLRSLEISPSPQKTVP